MPAEQFAYRRQADRNGKRSQRELSQDLIRWTILRRMFSNRQVHEIVVDFWSNRQHVPGFSDSWMLRASYESTIREYASGKFSTLLIKATTHPAMMVFLNSADSSKKSVNENHGRELLELHTVGVRAGYTEDIVLSSARLVSGDADEVTLLPDPIETLDAAERLVAMGSWCSPTSATIRCSARKLEDAGCAAVLLASAVTRAEQPVVMAQAMKLAVQAGRLARLAGRIPVRRYAEASSTHVGRIT